MANVRELAAMWARPHFTPESIRRYQDRKVRQLVRHAWKRVPYYRRLFEGAAIRPSDIRTVDDLARIPVSRHCDLQHAHVEDRIAAQIEPANCISRPTSGSTGEPVEVLRTRGEEYLLYGFRLRAQILSGLRMRDRRVKLGSPPLQLLPHRLGIYPMSNVSLDLGPYEIFRQLNALRPEVIYGIPNMFEALLQTIQSGQLSALRPRLIFSGAELLKESTRKSLEHVFNCPVVDQYGTQEFNLIAWECRHCGFYHTVDDSLIVEVLSDGRRAEPGEDGAVIGTALHSYAMPLIRVEVGDIVRRGIRSSSCPLPFGVIERIQGRTVDFLPMPDGSLLNPYHLVFAANSVPGLLQFQIVQEAHDRVAVLYVARSGDRAATAEEIRRRFHPFFPAGVALQVRPVPRLDLTPAGKLRLVRAVGDH